MMLRKGLFSAVVTLVALGLSTPAVTRGPAGIYAAAAKTPKLRRVYETWQAAHMRQGGDRNVVISLGYLKGLSTEFSQARGRAVLDLVEGEVTVTVTGLAETDEAHLWLVDNRTVPGSSVAPEDTDFMLHAGALTFAEGRAELSAELPPGLPEDFEVDLVVLTRGDQPPDKSGLLFGTRSLFQRLYTRSRRESPTAKSAAELFETLVQQGSVLFNVETFNGNGRTCATCHPAENNFTIDPEFIAGLPADDPLFVAEFNPDLAELEKPRLMREFGLILVNADGFEDPTVKFTMRGTNHTLALRTSLVVPEGERTGWGGDAGSLREFAIGAVTQHAPKTLARQPGLDFRLPTEAELDAMEAFQLSLGRQDDIDLAQVRVNDPTAARGQELFMAFDSEGGTVPTGKCNSCHNNAGARLSIDDFNRNFNTGIEVLEHPARLVEDFPFDGGFGTEPNFLFDTDGDGVPDAVEVLGNGTFNTPPLIEALDTAPLFHNHVAATIEEAVAFYNTDEFNESQIGRVLAGVDSGGVAVRLTAEESDALARFLRVLGTAENVRAAGDFLAGARDASIAGGKDRIELAVADTIDGIEILLGGGSLHPDATIYLFSALLSEKIAARSRVVFLRNVFIDAAIDALSEARNELGSGF